MKPETLLLLECFGAYVYALGWVHSTVTIHHYWISKGDRNGTLPAAIFVGFCWWLWMPVYTFMLMCQGPPPRES